MFTPGLYLVTPDMADADALAAAVAAVLPARPALVQYRNKLADARQRREQAARLLALCRGAGVPLVINDDLPLALAIGADGVHLGRDDGDPAEARRALGRGRILGVSCYNEWQRAVAGAAAGAGAGKCATATLMATGERITTVMTPPIVTTTTPLLIALATTMTCM